MYKSFGRRKAENKIVRMLNREFCNSSLLENPRTIEDIVNQLEKYWIHLESPKIPHVSDIEYVSRILPRIEMLVDSNHHFKVTDEGNILVSLPLLREDGKGNHETQKEIRYNRLEDGMEKVSIFDHRRHGTDRMFKNIRYVYDTKGIETERELEMLIRNQDASKTIYFFKERLPGYPHIIKVTANSKPTKEKGRVNYYDIRDSQQIEDLNQKEGKKIKEKDIQELAEEEKKEVMQRQRKPIYQEGLRSLLGIGIEQESR